MPASAVDPLARALLQVTAIAFAVSEVSIRLRSGRRREGTRADRGSIVVVVAGVAAGAVTAVWCVAAFPGATISGGAVRVAIGIVLMWLGIALRQWAVWVLGRFFTVVVRVSPGQAVIDHGPYRWVRHPSYSALLLTLVGLGVALGNWLSLSALVVLPTVGLAVRIRVEERALFSTLGEPYRVYAEHRRRLVPGIW